MTKGDWLPTTPPARKKTIVLRKKTKPAFGGLCYLPDAPVREENQITVPFGTHAFFVIT